MKKLLYLSTLLMLLACNDRPQKTAGPGPVSKKEQVSGFLSKYKETAFDTLEVYWEYDSKNSLYTGKLMDSMDVMMLPQNYREQYPRDGFFACARFKIDEKTTGLITRVPSTYESSSIVIFVFDEKEQQITSNYIELADVFGDAGDVMIKTSWLIKKTKSVSAFMHVAEAHDNSVEDETDTTQQSWDYYYLLDIGVEKTDTINVSFEELKTRFANLLEVMHLTNQEK